MSVPACTPPAWRRSTFTIALVGSLLMAAAQPNLFFHVQGWLGWIAPVPWLLLVTVDDLPGRRPYLKLYLAGLLFWLATIYWICLPHPILTIGWVALSVYLSIYVPLFVGISRIAVHRFDCPLWLAAPVVWTGLELARAHVMTGFLMGSLAHTQVHSTTLIQISDLVGEYGVDFVMVLFAACVVEVLRICDFGLRIALSNLKSEIRNPKLNLRRCAIAIVPAIIVLSATLGYGHFRIASVERKLAANGPKVALIQGNSLAEWKNDPNREQDIMKEYVRLSRNAIAENAKAENKRQVDLVVWPETMYRNPLREFEPNFKAPAKASVTPDEIMAGDHNILASLAMHISTPILVGIDRFQYVADDKSDSERPTVKAFNSAVLVEPDGTLVGTYDKMHRVMFGEYIPFADWIPYLYTITPLTGGIVAGKAPIGLRTKAGYRFAPNICYETAIPHVIRHQVATLNERGEHPDALVNLTNDAWYWGSSELDMHIACDVFRSVETRVPLVIAANGGISASIDAVGRIRHQLGKQVSGFLLVPIEPSSATSLYVKFGDWFAALCLAACLYLAIVEWKARRALRNRPVAQPTAP